MLNIFQHQFLKFADTSDKFIYFNRKTMQECSAMTLADPCKLTLVTPTVCSYQCPCLNQKCSFGLALQQPSGMNSGNVTLCDLTYSIS